MIVKICPTELWFGLASPDRRLDAMRENQTIRLAVTRDGAALLGQSGFLRPLGGSKSRVFAVVRPGVLERVQRRAHIRYQIDLPIRFRHVDPATLEPLGKAAGGLTENVSSGGLLFAVKFIRITAVDQDRTLRLIPLTEHRRREAARRQP